ncbi:MAG: hypothetical protein WC942_07330 [Clostridia bacterium]|jgi:hypothetical protein
MKNITNLNIAKGNTYITMGFISDGRAINFYFTNDEWHDFCTKSYVTFQDIAHRVDVLRQENIFYSICWPATRSGKVEIDYTRVIIPAFVKKIIFRMVRRMTCEQHIHISNEVISKWDRRSGVGAGRVRYEISDLKFFKECAKTAGFVENIKRLRQIAQNGTSRYWEVAKVTLSKDWDGWFFTVPGMHGGVINHGDNNSARWSIHT